MAGRMNMVMLMIMVVASMQLQGSMAQTRHTVGDTNGWNVPSTTSAYSTWASSQTFTVGDSLVFNFVTGAHNVAEVTRSAYDACNGTGPISLTGNGPATVNLPAAGTRYFICTVGTHCSLGQKVAINVSAAATTSPPAAQPAAPPTSVPAPVSPPPSATPEPTAAPISPPVSTPPAPGSPTATPPPSIANPPSTPSTPSPDGVNAPPPPNSGSSLAASAVLPAALLSIALAFFY